MAAFTQSGRLLQFSCTGLAPDALLIQSIQGVEGISQLFEVTIELWLPQSNAPVTPDELIGKNATVTLQPLGTDQPRWINGLISSVEQNWTFSDFDVYTVRLVPALWQATLNTDCRCLQNLKPMEVIKKVLEPYSLSLSDKTTGSSPDGKPYTTSDYTTQYNETDFDFMSRIAEQHGIFYWFDHSQSGKHILTFGNSRDGYAGDSFPVSFLSGQGSHELMYRPNVTEFRLTDTMVPGQHLRRDYDWRNHKPFVVNTVPSTKPGPGGKNAFEHYTFPSAGAPQFKNLGKQLQPAAGADASVEAQRNAADVASKQYHGASTSRALYPASTLDLDHPRDDWAQEYLVTSIMHRAQQAPPYQSDGSSMDGGYENRFTAIEATRIFSPPAQTARPRIAGMQSAVVVSPTGEDMSVDKDGRVCVQFLWNRGVKPDTLDNTWLRVAQQWAGSGWGTYFWPRKGDEVLVSFFNGDPDDPIIMGSAYNGVNKPKYGPADHSTRSGILTRSSLKGSAANANEMWFEDKLGAEQIVMHAERDFNTSVEVNNTRTVGNNESITVSNDRSVHVVKNQSINIDGNQTHFIDQTSEFTLGSTLKLLHKGDTHMTYQGRLLEKLAGDHCVHSQSSAEHKIGANYTVDAGSQIYVKSGTELVIEAGAALNLKVGGSHITINAAGITIWGPMVKINSVPAPMAGAPIVVTDPLLPKPKEANDRSPKAKAAGASAPAAATNPIHAGGVSGFLSGLWDSTGRPLVHMVEHPVDTARGIGHAAMHPIATGIALSHAISSTSTKAMSGDTYAIGTALGTVGMLAVPGAGEAEGVEDAARMGQLGELSEASEAGELAGPSGAMPSGMNAVEPGAAKLNSGVYPDFNPAAGNDNCGACSDAVHNYLTDGTVQPAQPGPRGWPVNAPADSFQYGQSPSTIEQAMTDAGDGSNGIIYVQQDGAAHVFNVTNDQGLITAIDGQTGVHGTITDVASHAGYDSPETWALSLKGK